MLNRKSTNRRLVSKSDLLTLIPAEGRRNSDIQVKVVVERGTISLKSLGMQGSLRKIKVNSKHNLRVVWVSDLIDDELGQIKNCFVLITPEDSYIFQADSHRMKIEWLQSLSIAISQSLKFRGSYRPSNWSNLDDLHKWLMVREVEYRFHNHPTYKGAIYKGKCNMGMPHIYGKMKWPNGDEYDGEFVYGKFEGSGTMMWLSHDKYRHYTGSWSDGTMEGYGEMIYTDQSTYTGWWHMGMRHRHGSMEYKHNNTTYIGGWELDKRSGYGILDNQSKSERYLGMWLNDKHHGAGIQVAQNKFQFSGNFINGERSYNVTRSMRRKSISVVQDQKWDSLFKCTSAILEQMVSCAHRERDATEAEVIVSTPKSFTSDADSAVAMDFSDVSASADLDTGCTSGTPSPYAHTANYIFPRYYEREGEEEEEDRSCTVCRIEGFKSVDHPLGLLVNSLTKCFIQSYSGVALHANLLPHAISELCSITSRVHQLVRKFCPSMITTDENQLLGKPKTHLSMLMKSKQRVRRKSSYHEPQQADSTWLYPIVLPSIFPTLFALYKEHYSRDDFKVSHVISSLNHHHDQELSSILEVRSSFEQWKIQGTCTTVVDPSKNQFSFSDYLNGATKIFQTISDYSTPGNKLLCIYETWKELYQLLSIMDAERETLSGSVLSQNSSCMKEEEEEEEEKFGSVFEDDDSMKGLCRTIVPTGILTLVIVKSRVKNLYSEIQFIQDFAGSTLLIDEYGQLLTKLKNSYYQLLELQL